jgi:hypothetical protein
MSQARVPAVHECGGMWLGRWIVDSKEVRVNKKDSPRISQEIHIDRKQPLGVSLKGSSVEVLAACRLSQSRLQVSRSSRVSLGYLKSAAQAECYRVFDKMVERASREIKRGLWPE